MKKLILILSLTITACGAPRAAPDTTVLEQKIAQALYRFDAALLDEAQSELTAEPNTPALVYFEGFAAYARANLAYSTDDKKILRAELEKADASLARMKEQPWKAEAFALRGQIAGHLIGVRGGSGAMSLGPKMMTFTSEAYESAPESGRVLTAHGVTLLNTPEMFGGDPDEALRLFQRAATALADEITKSSPLHWGRANALYWLAQAQLKKEEVS